MEQSKKYLYIEPYERNQLQFHEQTFIFEILFTKPFDMMLYSTSEKGFHPLGVKNL